MTNTIEVLEAIGRDASLRHASAEQLSKSLSGMHASDALKQAAISGDANHLASELGHRDIKAPNHVNNNVGGGHEDFDEGELEDGHQPDGDGKEKSVDDLG